MGVGAIKCMYGEFSDDLTSNFSPKDIYDIAERSKIGNQNAAMKTFAEMGEEAADIITHVVTIVYGLVVD